MILGILTLQIVSKFARFRMLVWLPDDGAQSPKHVGMDWCHVYVFMYASF